MTRIYSAGHVKYNRGEKWYFAFLRTDGHPRWSRRHFRTATEADAYGKRLAARMGKFCESVKNVQVS